MTTSLYSLYFAERVCKSELNLSGYGNYLTWPVGSHISGDFHAFTRAQAGLDLATQKGCKAELTKMVVKFQDSLPAKYGHLCEK